MDSVSEQLQRPYRRHKVPGKVEGCIVRLTRVLLAKRLPGTSRRRINAAISHLENALGDLEDEADRLKAAKINGG